MKYYGATNFYEGYVCVVAVIRCKVHYYCFYMKKI